MKNNNINILRLNYFLGLANISDLNHWAENQITYVNINDKIMDLYLVKNSNDAILLLNDLSKEEFLDSDDLKKYFYNLFLQKLHKNNIIEIEELLVLFKNNSNGFVKFSDDEDISYSIINNDMDLRKQFNIGQLELEDIRNFLQNDTQIK